MTLLALLLATLALRWWPELRSLQSNGWMQGLEDALRQVLPPALAPPRPVGLILWLLPVGLLLFLLDYWLAERSLLAALLVQVGILLHVLRLPELGLNETGEEMGDFVLNEPELLEQVQGWFGPAFWFALLGPAGAVLYRMLNREPETVTEPEACTPQLRLRWLVNFPIAQLMGLSLAVVDNFAPIFHHWKNQQCPETGSRVDLRCRFLGRMLRATVDDALQTARRLGEPLPENEGLARRRMVQQLMQRIQWVWFTVLALFTLGGLLG